MAFLGRCVSTLFGQSGAGRRGDRDGEGVGIGARWPETLLLDRMTLLTAGAGNPSALCHVVGFLSLSWACFSFQHRIGSDKGKCVKSGMGFSSEGRGEERGGGRERKSFDIPIESVCPHMKTSGQRSLWLANGDIYDPPIIPS